MKHLLVTQLYKNSFNAFDMTWAEPVGGVLSALMPVYTLLTKLAERLTEALYLAAVLSFYLT